MKSVMDYELVKEITSDLMTTTNAEQERCKLIVMGLLASHCVHWRSNSSTLYFVFRFFKKQKKTKKKKRKRLLIRKLSKMNNYQLSKCAI